MTNLIFTLLLTISAVTIFCINMALIIRSKENITIRLFGYFLSAVSIIVFAESSFNINTYFTTGQIVNHLIDGKIIIFYLGGVSFFTLLPTLSLLSDLSNIKKILISLIPPVICIITYFILSSDVIKYTTLHDLGSFEANISLLKNNIDNPDIQIRLVLLSLTLIIPIIIIGYTFYINISHRKRILTKSYTFTYISTIVISLLFIGCMLDITWMYHLFCFICPAYLISISLLLLNNDSFLTKKIISPSSSLEPFPKELEESSFDRSNEDIWESFELAIKKNERFTQEISSQQIADEMKVNVILLNSLLHFRGYNSFIEYVNILRLNKFKELAFASPKEKIVELSERAGFTSKSVFYRVFQSIEDMTPTEYIKTLKKDNYE